MTDYLADVGRRLRDARLANRPDLDSIPKASRELQDQYGIQNSEKQYGRWERGESEPRGAKREALARMLQVRPEDIWGEAPIAPEEELRQELASIHRKLDLILNGMGLSPSAAAEAAEVAAQATEQRKAASGRTQGATPKKRQSG